MTINPAVFAVPPAVAEIVTAAVAVTELVVTVKTAVLLPPGTVTLGGTFAAEVLLLESATATPPPGAVVLNVTVP